MADLYYDKVVLLLPMNGADGETAFADYSTFRRTVAISGNVHTETDSSKFYGSSGYFDGSGDYLTPPASVFAFGTNDFTIEFWCNVLTETVTYPYIFASSHDAGKGCYSYINISTGVFVFSSGTGLAYRPYLVSTTAIRNAGWTHIAISRSGNTAKLFVNGVLEATHTAAGTADYTTDNTPRIMSAAHTTTNVTAKGYLQDLRITNGVARYTEDFTPPGALYGKTISGTIYDANGDAAQRTVLAVPRSYPNNWVFATQSAADGTYSLTVPDVECSRIVLADETTLYNDIVDRVLPG